ncbi:hypothetical protein HXX76_000562 [Chlamydomonas incerta]|uniref:Uncharacterized protein n=1 Tax=Chlamydomonas incerta TaxID=51695 RepID=A0A836B356_CHLIN|nr:hypothetical protein HXX76_000562 [Chlamydomonas incerta]|eukprot:KAG2445959.1 hypothetical protein HXX76_000562 [Chlamydomonas incerta]
MWSARKLLPEVDSLHLRAYHQCIEEAALLRTVHAVTRWSHLQHLRISLDESPLDESTLVAEWLERTGRSSQQEASNDVLLHYRPTGPRPQATMFCELCMGALGRLTNLRSLALSGVPMASNTRLGLYGLSTLERLTSLELLNDRGTNSWTRDAHPDDTELRCLTSLRRLSISGELLSPAVMSALAQLSSLTRLQLDLRHPEEVAEALTSERLSKLQQLRALHVACGSIGSNAHAAATQVVTSVLQSVQTLAVAVRERQEQEQAQAPAQQRPRSTPARMAASDHRQPAIKAEGASGPYGLSRRRKQRSSRRACLAAKGCAATAPSPDLRHRIATTSATIDSGMDEEEEEEEEEGGAVDGSTMRPLRVYLDLAPSDSPHLLHLTPGLIDALCDLGPALRSLDAGFGTGSASNLYRLTELTELTSLSLRCLPGTHPDLASWDLQRLGAACTQLHTLRLALPPERMDAAVPGLAFGSADTAGGSALSAATSRTAAMRGASSGSGCFPRLRVLELQAYVHTKEVVVGLPDLQPRLAELLAAQLQEQGVECQHVGAPPAHGVQHAMNSTSCASPADITPQPGPPLVPEQLRQRAVAMAREPLSTLAQLMHALPTVDGVQQTLIDEANWRDRRRQARLQALIEQGMTEEAAEEVTQREAVAATPTVPLWVLGQYLTPAQVVANILLTGDEGGSDGAAWLAGPGAAGGAAAGDQAMLEPAALQRAHKELAQACQPVAMHLLGVRQLLALREVLLCEEVVAGPVFRLAAWTPRNLQRLRLEGFVGLSFGRGNGNGGGLGGGEAAALIASGVDWAPPSLWEVEVTLHGGPAEEAEALTGLRVWREAAAAAAAATCDTATTAGGAVLSVQSRCQLWGENAR